MPPVYVTTQGSKIHIENRRLAVEHDAETLLAIPLGQVSQLVLFGNVGLTTPAIDGLLGQGAEVIFLTQRGDYRGRLVGTVTPHVPLRRAQYGRLGQASFVLAMAQGFVEAKLEHQRALLQRHNRERHDPVVEESIARVSLGVEGVPRKTALSALNGLEGAATAAYFQGYRRLLGPDWRFQRRERRPPPDPVNVLLSFGYTLLAQTCAGAVEAVGLDPYAGFLHEVVYNRPALALDLMEEFRPVVDGVVLWCCNGAQITPADFSPGPADRPVVLSDQGARRFVQAYETRMDQPFTHPLRGVRYPLRQCIVEQARQVADRLLNGPPGYRGMGFR